MTRKRRTDSVFNLAMWREVLRDVWKLFLRHPILAVWPYTLYLRFFEPEKLRRMVEEAEGD